MQILGKIFGSESRVKIIRLFLLNPDKIFPLKETALAAGKSKGMVEKEILAFERAGFIRRKSSLKISDQKPKPEKVSGWVLNKEFEYLPELRNLIVNTISAKNCDLVQKLSKAGSLKLVVVSGLFIQNWESRVDILVVAEKINKRLMERVIKTMEWELGKELRYTILERSDFLFRQSVGDRLLRDIFDFPHKTLIDKLGLKKR